MSTDGPKYPLDEETRKRVEELFTYHKPLADQPERFQSVSEALKYAALIVCANVPPGVQRDRALEFLVTARMWANAGIATNEREGLVICAGNHTILGD
jgi:hypothetical protein